MDIICPECKNEVDESTQPSIEEDDIIECQMCGINLLVTDINDENVEVEVVEEGK